MPEILRRALGHAHASYFGFSVRPLLDKNLRAAEGDAYVAAARLEGVAGRGAGDELGWAVCIIVMQAHRRVGAACWFADYRHGGGGAVQGPVEVDAVLIELAHYRRGYAVLAG